MRVGLGRELLRTSRRRVGVSRSDDLTHHARRRDARLLLVPAIRVVVGILGLRDHGRAQMVRIHALLVGQAGDIGQVSRLFKFHLVDALRCAEVLSSEQALGALGYLVVAGLQRGDRRVAAHLGLLDLSRRGRVEILVAPLLLWDDLARFGQISQVHLRHRVVHAHQLAGRRVVLLELAVRGAADVAGSPLIA